MIVPIICPFGMRAANAITGMTAIYKNRQFRIIWINVCNTDVAEIPGNPIIRSAITVNAALTSPKNKESNAHRKNHSNVIFDYLFRKERKGPNGSVQCGCRKNR